MFYRTLIFPKLKVQAITLYPFIIFRNDALRQNQVLLNHELIHIKQQKELLVLPFHMLYSIYYLINLFRLKNHDAAYRDIIFEREADSEENNPAYLAQRRFCAWRNY